MLLCENTTPLQSLTYESTRYQDLLLCSGMHQCPIENYVALNIKAELVLLFLGDCDRCAAEYY